MNSDAVIGCDAVDAGAEWLRLKTASGATRSIPWNAIKFAGMGENMHAHITIKGLTEKVAPFLATHDSLWIVYADGGFALVMLEKTAPSATRSSPHSLSTCKAAGRAMSCKHPI